jgi:ssDNA-specific exonuclease RecJ
LEDFLFDKYKVNWQNRMFSQKVGNKLRTYTLFKEVFETEMYLSKNIPCRYRSAFAKIRCGVAPLRIETGRYENKNVNERVCFICHDQIEDEKHVLLDCPLYADLRESLFNEVKRSNVHFIILSDDDKFIYLFKSTECYDTVAKTCFNILSRRNSFYILDGWLTFY